MQLRVHSNQRWEWNYDLLRTASGKEIIHHLKNATTLKGDLSMNQLGKRYKCQVCGTEVLCTKAGEGTISCDDKPMETQEPRPVPSSD